VKILRAEHLAAAARPEDFPKPGAPEIAFLGRSNVGKSSLINRLVQRRSLARTSHTPGKTRLVHWYRLERSAGELWLVDLPGYGYARVSKQARRGWQQLVERYLEARPSLRVALLLQDLRRDLSDDERLLIQWLDARRVPVLVALTKCDKLKPMRRAARVRALREQLAQPVEHVIATSAQQGLGLPQLWRALEAFVA